MSDDWVENPLDRLYGKRLKDDVTDGGQDNELDELDNDSQDDFPAPQQRSALSQATVPLTQKTLEAIIGTQAILIDQTRVFEQHRMLLERIAENELPDRHLVQILGNIDPNKGDKRTPGRRQFNTQADPETLARIVRCQDKLRHRTRAATLAYAFKVLEAYLATGEDLP